MDFDKLTPEERYKIAASNNGLGIPVHLNGTAGAGPTKYPLVMPFSTALIVSNTHSANTLYVSFDEGVTYFSIAASNSLSVEDVAVSDIYVSGTGTTFEVLYY